MEVLFGSKFDLKYLQAINAYCSLLINLNYLTKLIAFNQQSELLGHLCHLMLKLTYHAMTSLFAAESLYSVLMSLRYVNVFAADWTDPCPKDGSLNLMPT